MVAIAMRLNDSRDSLIVNLKSKFEILNLGLVLSECQPSSAVKVVRVRVRAAISLSDALLYLFIYFIYLINSSSSPSIPLPYSRS